MKTFLPLLFIAVIIASCNRPEGVKKTDEHEELIDSLEQNNDFYDNTPVQRMDADSYSISIKGETDTLINVKLSDFPQREVIVREALHTAQGDSFIGAYTYSGVSLYDILKDVKVQKSTDFFKPIIDQYIIVEGQDGSRATISWGELYYPEVRHDMIIATSVSRIRPTKTNEMWPMPQLPKLVIAHDLLDSRNISKPVSIEIRSWQQEPVELSLDSLYTRELYFAIEDDVMDLQLSPEAFRKYSAPTIFYGRGRGIHGITNFEGYDIAEFLKHFAAHKDPQNLRNGKVIFHGADGYRAVFSFSEIVNRNDDGKLLWMERHEEGGKYRLLPTYDFFSDRAVKSLYKIEMVDVKKVYLSAPQ